VKNIIKTVVFKPKNGVKCSQDRSYYKNVPHGIRFEVIKENGFVKLRASGYGVLGKKPSEYGNGLIYLQKERYTA